MYMNNVCKDMDSNNCPLSAQETGDCPSIVVALIKLKQEININSLRHTTY